MSQVFFLQLLNPRLAIKTLVKNKTLLAQMVRRSVAVRYKGAVLGILWSLAHPLLMLSVYTFVFGFVFKVRWGTEHIATGEVPFPLIMFCGMAIFNIFAESVNNSAGIITGNPTYVKKVVFPLEILPFSAVLTSLIFSLAWIVLLVFGMILFVQELHWTIVLFPLLVFPLFLFTCGFAFLVASLGVYLRDIQYIVGIITQILFFMTPIFYPISLVPEQLRWVLEYNPLSCFVEETRKVILFGMLPDWTVYGICLAVSYIVFQLGLNWFSKTKKGFADVL